MARKFGVGATQRRSAGRLATGDEFLFRAVVDSRVRFAQQCLFTLSVDGELRCWSARDGELVWRRSLHEDFSIERRDRIGRSGGCETMA
ncbi:MAG: hypothetical protein R3B96_08705 [Pirellulaceae bacterium]